MKSKRFQQEANFYFKILELLKHSTNLKTIQNSLSLSKQALNYYLRRLSKKGLIINKGYGHWEVISQSKVLPKDTQLEDSIRGHAFTWTIQIPKEIQNWENRIEILRKSKIPYKLIGILKTTPRIIINNKKIWLGNKTITIYDPKSFYAKDSIESRKYAVIELLETIYKLERKLQINLHPYHFKPSREHYGQIKNILAIQHNRKGEKLHIKDNGEEWLWIDDSESLGELETNNLVRSKQVQDWWNDQKKHNFEVTPTFLLETINKVTDNQLMFAKNIETHMEILQEMNKTLKLIQQKLESTK